MRQRLKKRFSRLKGMRKPESYMNLSSSGAIDVPRLSARVWRGGVKRRGVIHYEHSDHRDAPHVVKFSGGRSSGLLLLILLENGLLNAERGDVVLFTNTSAEHPATYDFVRKMKRVTERMGIPFFLTQLQTVETVASGEWRRRLTYRLTTDQPKSPKNPWGYSYRGEVFEEAVVWNGMLPSVHVRVCTTLMKMFVTREFLSDWFGGAWRIPMQGHANKTSQVNPEVLYREHLLNSGKMSPREYRQRYDILSEFPTYRPSQTLGDYTKAPLEQGKNKKLRKSVLGNRCELFGEQSATFLTFLGFRFGEDSRYQRMMQRNRGAKTPGHDTHPSGEFSYAPLFDLGLDQTKVLRFWDKQPTQLRPLLPTDINLSNCVYCFLKGERSLATIKNSKKKFEKTLPEALQKECRKRNTPNSIDWWARLEDSRKRPANKKSGNGVKRQTFGMFGLKNIDYQTIKQRAVQAKRKDQKVAELPPAPVINCECTD